MRHATDELNPHVHTDEHHNAPERHAPCETAIEETLLFPEQKASDEAPAQTQSDKGRRTSTDGHMRLLTQYLATTTVVCATAGAVILPIASAPAATIDHEDIGYSTYECILTTEEEDLEVIIENMLGDVLFSAPLEEEGTHTIRADALLPEERYQLRLLNDNGRERFTHTFSTDPFLTFGAANGGTTPLILHESLRDDSATAIDMSLMLFDSRGGDFSSCIYRGEAGEGIYLYTDGLYQDTYTLQLMIHPPDSEPIIYQKTYEAQGKRMLSYSVTHTMGDGSFDGPVAQLTFTYEQGDIPPYTISFASAEHLTDFTVYYSFDSAEITQEGNDIIITLTDPLIEGDYRISLWGTYTAEGEWTQDNEIWTGTLHVTPVE